jgi:ABC-2 type transport system permease protein
MYFSFIKLHLKVELEYRVSLILVSLGQFMTSFSVFIGLYALFKRFGNLEGWDLYEVALGFSIVNITFAFHECFLRGFDSFSKLIREGLFDRVLVRPRNLVFQVITFEFELSRIGKFLQGSLIMVIALINLNIEWNFVKLLLLILIFISGFFIFGAISVLTATACFWTVEGLEITNIFSHGGRELSQYPITIYKKWFRRFFTYVIPLASFNYLPLMYILDKSKSIYCFLSPIYGILFIIPCFLVWNIGVKHYKSTGS